MTAERDAHEVHAFVDDELDLRTRLDIESRLDHDAELRAQVEVVRLLRQVVHEGATYHAAPRDLRAAIVKSMPARPRKVEPAKHEPSRWAAWASSWSWRPAMATAFTAVLAVSGAQLWLAQSHRDDGLANEVIASHVRSTLGDHLVDIASSDHHVVKPWLSQRLDFSPPIGDEKVGNANFVGGRLDYLNQRPVAALVYRAGGHVAEVFVWPNGGKDREIRYLDDRGFQIAHWSRNGMAHWVISDVSREAFVGFVEAVAGVEGVR